jgi:hypothetical protein
MGTTEDRDVKLIGEVLTEISRSQRWVLVPANHELVLKPIEEVDVLDRAALLADDTPMLLEEISEDVHRYRRERQRSASP